MVEIPLEDEAEPKAHSREQSMWNCCSVETHEPEVLIDRHAVQQASSFEVDPPYISPLRLREREKNPYANYITKK